MNVLIGSVRHAVLHRPGRVVGCTRSLVSIRCGPMTVTPASPFEFSTTVKLSKEEEGTEAPYAAFGALGYKVRTASL